MNQIMMEMVFAAIFEPLNKSLHLLFFYPHNRCKNHIKDGKVQCQNLFYYKGKWYEAKCDNYERIINCKYYVSSEFCPYLRISACALEEDGYCPEFKEK